MLKKSIRSSSPSFIVIHGLINSLPIQYMAWFGQLIQYMAWFGQLGAFWNAAGAYF
jgi:hypothetical protein